MANVDDRTGLESIPEATCWDPLRAETVARLAVTVGSRPDIFPVNYTVRDDDILIRTAPGTKLAGAVIGRWVALEIDDTDTEQRLGWSVVVHGTADELERLEDIVEAEAAGPEPWADAAKNRWLRIVAHEVTGRRIPARSAGTERSP